MNVGTRSLLFGVHQFILHPLFVWLAWRRVYGTWPDWRTTVSIVIHDIGYFGCRDIDGKEGSRHPEFGARLAEQWLGREQRAMVLLHSRSTAREHGAAVSPLCLPDKLSLFIYPPWLYTLLAVLSGEYREYQANAGLGRQARRLLIHHFRVSAFQWALRSEIGPAVRRRVIACFGEPYRRSLRVSKVGIENPGPVAA